MNFTACSSGDAFGRRRCQSTEPTGPPAGVSHPPRPGQAADRRWKPDSSTLRPRSSAAAALPAACTRCRPDPTSRRSGSPAAPCVRRRMHRAPSFSIDGAQRATCRRRSPTSTWPSRPVRRWKTDSHDSPVPAVRRRRAHGRPAHEADRVATSRRSVSPAAPAPPAVDTRGDRIPPLPVLAIERLRRAGCRGH